MDFIGIGAQKCGTSKIAKLLAAHPEICLSEPKDISYFNERVSYIHGKHNLNRNKGFDWYQNHFKHCSTDSVKGEFGTGYMWCPVAAKLIYESFPNIKIIAAIRQPAERAFSQYLMLRFFQEREHRSFEELIQLEPEFIDKGKYAQQLQPYYELFGSSQILVINMEDLNTNPGTIAKQLYRFLGVSDDFIPNDLETRVNTAKTIRFRFLSILYGKIMVKMIDCGFSNVINTLRKTGIKKIYDRINYINTATLPQISNKNYNHITKECLNDIQALEILLDRDFSHWKEMRDY